MPIRWKIPAVGLLLLLAIAKNDVIAQNTAVPTMTLLVDETQAFRRIAFIHEEIRVQPGPLALAYPRWIPGEHGPTGPIENLAMIHVRSGEVTLPWTRDPEDINTIKVDVPANTSEITVDFDTLVIRNFDTVETREIQYAGGLRYPHLERIPGTHDYLTEILAPRNVEGK